VTPSVDIPVMRGDEATYITLDAESDDPFIVWGAVLASSGYITVGAERMAIRTHLLVPRERYPEPPKWDGWEDQQVPIDVDTGACKVNAAPNGLVIYVTDEYDYVLGDEPDATIPWADVIAAMRKIGVKVNQE
jgi:hypothetical protein